MPLAVSHARVRPSATPSHPEIRALLRHVARRLLALRTSGGGCMTRIRCRITAKPGAG